MNSKNKYCNKIEKSSQRTASNGDNTLVETTVAIEFPASFIPFKKSNINAIMIAAITTVDIPEKLC